MKFVRVELKGPKLLRPPGPGFLTRGPGQPYFPKRHTLPGFLSSSHRADSATRGSPPFTNCEGLLERVWPGEPSFLSCYVAEDTDTLTVPPLPSEVTCGTSA
ncbi:unnamed protein product [Rangifer tarandus platyrhynchus]|uniref:Uncharacterized protein n=2 Tax=Rangifer tarandus platyrhynchus TaxID=3082113 RepID=A0AC59YPK9_RANTA|nr:unnamed protein product [Rangifer tarandus platyrhynchus]